MEELLCCIPTETVSYTVTKNVFLQPEACLCRADLLPQYSLCQSECGARSIAGPFLCVSMVLYGVFL